MMESRVYRIINDLFSYLKNTNAIPITYFAGTRNIGDLLNEYLIPRITNTPIFCVQSSILPHLRAVGSLIGSAAQTSYIWGAGSIDGKIPYRRLDSNKIFAVRGHLTLEMLRKSGLKINDIPLGDPALLMPQFFQPKEGKKFDIGIIPHFSDREILKEFTASSFRSIIIIDVSLPYQEFIETLVSCRYTLSSSLHGLILSDAYNIPNKWVKLSDQLLGGSFKFKDYYSITNKPNERYININSSIELIEIIKSASMVCEVKEPRNNVSDLLNSFPDRFLRN